MLEATASGSGGYASSPYTSPGTETAMSLSADHYYRRTAEDYDRKRSGTNIWEREHRYISRLVAKTPPGSRCLDVPVGTGRFVASYAAQELSVVGVDISGDMLREAGKKAREVGGDIDLVEGSILELDLPDNSFDLTVCVRMLQWLTPGNVDRAMGELSRVTRKRVAVTVHYQHGAGDASERALKARTRNKAKRARERQQGRAQHVRHRLPFLLESFSRNGLAVERERVISESPGWSRYALFTLRTDRRAA